jgi:hypothetical protein
MVQIPDTIRPYVTILQKFHFWMLAALAPLVLLPLLFMAQAGIAQKIKTQRSKIESSLSSIETILENEPHPNEKWSEQIGTRVRTINDETLQVWEQLWKAQEPLRQWPESLGKSFVRAASSLKADQSLSQAALEAYQNGIKPVVRQIPGRMGADELMSDAGSDDGLSPPRRQSVDRGALEEPPSLLQWSGEDQQALFTSFDWEEPPSTTQVVMAQEELWMYGVLCDVIRKVNTTPVAADPNAVITPANIAIPLVEELKVGYPAAEDDPGGKTSQRILRIQRSGGGLGEETPFSGDMMEMGAGGEDAGRPPHPRFGGGRGRGGPMGMMPGGSDEFGESAADGSPDDALKNWVFVDLDGKPLTASDLASASTSNILRLMPFVLRATIDQRALDALLVELASAPVPIDTRQVRINADQASGGDFGGRGSGRRRGIRPPRSSNRMGGEGIGGDRARLHDVNVELRGTLAIVMRPDPKLLTADDGGGEGEDSE